jgi:NodT family efflux transporter outer membrane factor (OMF) lipoprotein
MTPTGKQVSCQESRSERQFRVRICSSLAAVLWIAVFATSCSVIRVPSTPEQPVEVPGAFSQHGEVALEERWWESLGDRELDSLIERALGDNFDLQIAWDRLDHAAALARKAGAALWPTLDVEASGSRTYSKGTTISSFRLGSFDLGSLAGADGGGETTTRDRFLLALPAAYEVDLWGRVRRTRRAAKLDVLASSADLSAAAMTLSAEVATTWYGLVEQRAILKILKEQILTNEKFLELVEFRYGHSQTSAVDVYQQRRQLETTRGEVPIATSRMHVLEHQLAVLLGSVPRQKAARESDTLPQELPPLPQTGLPAELVRRRPDLLSAHARLASANQRVAASIAERFPALRLTGRAETDAEKVGDLFDDWLASLAGNLIGPILDGGSRAAEVARSRAIAAEQLHQYANLVLRALQEVEDALIREQRQREYLVSLDKQIELSRQLVNESRLRYVNGDTDYLPVLEAIATLQRLERSRIEASRALIEYRVALYRSLAGGWEMRRAQRDDTTNKSDLGDTD